MLSKTKVSNSRERLELVVVHLAAVIDALVYLASLTLLNTELKAYVLFDLFEK